MIIDKTRPSSSLYITMSDCKTVIGVTVEINEVRRQEVRVDVDVHSPSPLPALQRILAIKIT